MELMSRKLVLTCPRHGKSHASYLCRHLFRGKGLHYYAKKLPKNHPAAWQAWCVECHSVILAEGGMNKRASNFMAGSLVCTQCFRDATSLNKRLRLPA